MFESLESMRCVRTTVLALLIHLSTHGNMRANPLALAQPVSERSSSSPLTLPVFRIDPWTAGGMHCVNLSFGTPPQPLTFVLDVQDSGFLVNAANNTHCDPKSKARCIGGTYDIEASLTSKEIKACDPCTSTNLTDGEFLTSRVSDFVQVDNALLESVDFQLVMSDNDYYWNSDNAQVANLLGLGYTLNELTSTPYPSLVEVLVDAKVVDSTVFAIALPVEDSYPDDINFGELVLGGFNPAYITKNQRPVTLDFMAVGADSSKNVSGLVRAPVVPITKLTLTSPELNRSYPAVENHGDSGYAVMIDYTYGQWEVPPEIFDAFISVYNATGELRSDGVALCDANLTTGIKINIDFGQGFSITLYEFLTPWYQKSGLQSTDANGRLLCLLALSKADMTDGAPHPSMGTIVTRNLYSIFDLDYGQITIGQRDTYVDTSVNALRLPKGPNAVQEALSKLYTTTHPVQSSSAVASKSVSLTVITYTTARRIAAPAYTGSTSYRIVSDSPLNYSMGGPQDYLPLDARTSDMITIQSTLSAGTLTLETPKVTATSSSALNSTVSTGYRTCGIPSLEMTLMAMLCMLLCS